MPRESKAQVLSKAEFKRVLKTLAGEPHAVRNPALRYLSVGLGFERISALPLPWRGRRVRPFAPLRKDSPGNPFPDEVVMLITFRTKSYADITLFGDIAVQLLQMMGHSGTVPGAILAADIPAALARLKQALTADHAAAPADTQDEAKDEDATEPTVGLAQRAFPLIELLTAAAKAHGDVVWE